jgi:hypothetical protein
MAFRLILLSAACLLVFFLPLPRSYYFSLMKYSDYSKMNWVENKLNTVGTLDSTIVFVGSSICLNGINDSLLNALDTGTTQYLNCGITHTCYAVIDAMLEEMLDKKKLRPKKVILCFKGDAMARYIHNMYPAQASTSHILQSATAFNTQFFPSFLKRVSWNVHSITHLTKYEQTDPEKEFISSYGFKPQNTLAVEKVEKSYKNLRTGSEANFNAIQNQNEGNDLPLKSKVSVALTDVTQNILYQRSIFERSAQRLDDLNIPYDILVYPNLVSARMEKQGIMANYVKRTFTGIDFDNHRVIAVTDTAFSNARYYVDMNHLNPKGADLLTNFVYNELKESK